MASFWDRDHALPPIIANDFSTMRILGDIGTGMVIAFLIYQVVENWELLCSAKRIPKAPITGPGALFDSYVDVVESFAHSSPEAPALGVVRVGGELWRARITGAMERLPQMGERVRIIGREGLELRVVLANEPEPG